MVDPDVITFVSHTNKPGGGELALRRYLQATTLPVRLVTTVPGGVWAGMRCEVRHAPRPLALRRALAGSGLVVANSMRAALFVALVAPRGSRLAYWVRDGLTNSAMSPIAVGVTKYVTSHRFQHYIANSEWTANGVQEALRVRPEQAVVVYSMCGVTDSLNRPPRPVPAPNEPLRLLFLGRLSPWKAPHTAIHALSHLRDLRIDATLTIAGDSLFGEEAYAAELASLAQREQGVTLVGHIDDVSTLMEEHHVLVHCSTSPEPFGQVIVQGLASGLPVIATAHGGPLEILEGSPYSTLVPPYDPAALAATVKTTLTHYSELSQWSLSRAKEFADVQLCHETNEALARLFEN